MLHFIANMNNKGTFIQNQKQYYAVIRAPIKFKKYCKVRIYIT